ncbi:F0F1 ATP synthase subunit A [bacterium]|jgi:F-type H+-transporting ATPase subunit a|nr:F0F1 ATP synthase subunit A [bacterium]
MENLGQVTLITLNLFGRSIEVNPTTFIMTWIVMGLILGFGLIAGRQLKTIPGKLQNIFELLFEFIEDITLNSLGHKDGKRYVPFIFTLFIFVLVSNWIGVFPNIGKFIGSIIALVHSLIGSDGVEFAFKGLTNLQFTVDPNVWYAFLLNTPDLSEPTRSVNTDMALALMVFIIAHLHGIFKNGPLEYLKGYWGDIIPCRGWYLLLAPINIMLPLNIIGEISSVVSHSFRLFGNIFGGFMIITIVSSLVKFIFLPVGLLAFFGLFAGVVQAFVFTMLAITYIGQKN